MSRYRPEQLEIAANGLILRRLRTLPEFHDQFITSVVSSIEADYDEITPEFAANLIAIDSHEDDPNGYFTFGKEVWVVFTDQNEFIGFEVITRKRGGSIKLGPTFITADKRGQGYAPRMIGVLEQAYKAAGARKVYVTAPLANAGTAVLDFKSLQLQLEAILNDHYKRGSAERVCGRFLQPVQYKAYRPEVGFNSHVAVQCVEGFGPAAQSDIATFVVTNMQHDYDDIDESFAASIARGYQKDATRYEHKPKIVRTLFSNDKLVGLVAITPKRGGTYKVAPFLVDPEFRSKAAIQMLLDEIIEIAGKAKRTKVSIVLPVRDCNIMQVIAASGFYSEGILRSPYKPGSDMVVLSKSLT